MAYWKERPKPVNWTTLSMTKRMPESKNFNSINAIAVARRTNPPMIEIMRWQSIAEIT